MMSDSNFAESDVDELPYEGQLLEIDAAGASLQLKLHSEADVRRTVLEIAEDARLFDEVPFSQSEVPPETPELTLLELNYQTFAKEFVAALKYVLSTHEKLKAGQEPPIETSMARECGLCKGRWPTFVHFLLTPTPPTYLRCAICMKRVPVGHNIRPIPKRKAQPHIVDMQGRTIQLSGKMLNGTIPTIDTRQQCVAEDCPLKNCYPHSGRSLPYSLCLFVDITLGSTPEILLVM